MRKLPHLLLTSTLLLAGCTHSAATKHDPAADEAALRALDTKWVTVAQTHDVNAWLAFYSDDAVLLPPNDKTTTGREAARKSISELLGLPHLVISWSTTKADVSGDLGYLVGAYTLAFDGPNGTRINDTGKTLSIWRRQPDGSWKCTADTWSSDLPATPPTP